MKTKLCVELKTAIIDIVINSLLEDNTSGYVININDDIELYCLDDDHVSRELYDFGVDESTIDFLIKHL